MLLSSINFFLNLVAASDTQTTIGSDKVTITVVGTSDRANTASRCLHDFIKQFKEVSQSFSFVLHICIVKLIGFFLLVSSLLTSLNTVNTRSSKHRFATISKYKKFMAYRITGIFCDCLFSAVFCGYEKSAEIEIAKYS